MALIFAIVSALIVGGLLWVFDQKLGFYLILLFPAVAGIIVGTITAKGINVGKLRNPMLAGLICMLGGLLATGTYHFLNYQFGFRNDVRQAISAQNSGVNPSELKVQKAVDDYLRGQVGDTGFVGFLKVEIKQGISISRGSSNSGAVLTDAWAAGYFIFEGLVVAGLAALWGASAAREPFDEKANAWFGRSAFFGAVSVEQADLLVTALRTGSFEQAGNLVRPQWSEPNSSRIELHARFSPDKNAAETVLEVKAVTPGKKKNEQVSKILMSGLLRREDLMHLLPTKI